MTTLTLAIAIGWVVCGVLAYGINVAYFQRKFPSIAAEKYREDCANCCDMVRLTIQAERSMPPSDAGSYRGGDYK